MRPATDQQRLHQSIERAIARGEPNDYVLPMVERLHRLSPRDGDERLDAARLLAELLLERAPFRAASLLRGLVRARPLDAGNWALMGLAMSLLGHVRAACVAYRRALAIDPGNPSYSHNLGHLLDAGLNRPLEALRYLEDAARRAPEVDDIVCSLAHARFRAGDFHGARAGIDRLSRRGAARHPDVRALSAALEGVPAPRRARARRKRGDLPT